jgi:hypothetical protein
VKHEAVVVYPIAAMNTRVDSVGISTAGDQLAGGGETPTSTLHVKDLFFKEHDKAVCVDLVRKWHSRLPNTQRGPWTHAFAAVHDGRIYAVALWNSPSARTLPSHWRELRRMACAPDAPKNTASWFLAHMVRWFRRLEPQRERVLSYQDTAVHKGTIYKAAGWHPVYVSKPRVRDRSGNRTGTERKYRWNINGIEQDAAAKVRWEYIL